jgi:hypothetical protein
MLRRVLHAGLTIAVGCGVLVGLAPTSSAASLTVTDITITWPDLAWVPGQCQFVGFAWGTASDTLQLEISTRLYGVPVNLNNRSYPSSGDLNLGIGMDRGSSGLTEINICGPATADEAKALMLVATRDFYSSQGGGQARAERPLYTTVNQPVPSAPSAVTGAVLDRQAQIGWAAPGSNAQFVTKYTVTDVVTGAVVCTVPTAGLSCTVGDLADGAHSFVVTALNSDGAGSPSAPTPSTVVGPPKAPKAPSTKLVKGKLRVLWSTATGTSAVPARYVVTSGKGKRFCSLAPTASDFERGYSQCIKPALPGRNTYKVTVVTALGSATSGVSKPVG